MSKRGCKELDINTTNRIHIHKQKLGVEDLLWGTGTVEQIRLNKPVTITEINAKHIPYDDNFSIWERVEDLVIIKENWELIEIIAGDLRGFCPVKFDFGSTDEVIDTTIKCCGSAIRTVARNIDAVIKTAEGIEGGLFLRVDANLSDVACYHLARMNLATDYGWVTSVNDDGTYIITDADGNPIAECEPSTPIIPDPIDPPEDCGHLIKAQQVQLRRGTKESQEERFRGAEGEVSVDTDEWRLWVQKGDGTAGIPTARLDELKAIENKYDTDIANLWEAINTINVTIEGIQTDIDGIKEDIANLYETKLDKEDLPKFATVEEAKEGVSEDTIISPYTLQQVRTGSGGRTYIDFTSRIKTENSGNAAYFNYDFTAPYDCWYIFDAYTPRYPYSGPDGGVVTTSTDFQLVSTTIGDIDYLILDKNDAQPYDYVYIVEQAGYRKNWYHVEMYLKQGDRLRFKRINADARTVVSVKTLYYKIRNN